MIYTFYSYKGGTGRSMALANIAQLLYDRGLKVLAIDFDLEAPGLERYFLDPESYQNGKWEECRGVIDLLESYQEFFTTFKDFSKQEGADLNSQHLVINRFFEDSGFLDDFIVNIYHKNDNGGELSLMTSGRRCSFQEYASTVQRFDSDDFRSNYLGNDFFNEFIKKVKEKFQVILVDSRTGVTEMGGVCTHHLADTVVLFTTSNDQSLYGTNKVVKSLTNNELIGKRNGRKISLIIIPSKVDNSEKKNVDIFEYEFENIFGTNQKKINEAVLKFKNKAFIDLRIPYIPYYSYKEILVVRENHASSISLKEAYENIAYTMSQLVEEDHPFYQAFSPTGNFIEQEVNHSIIKEDWGTAPESDNFFGRTQELEDLEKWILTDRCRILAILGMGGVGKTNLSIRLGKGGIGKTDLSLKLARGIREHFDFVVWRSLQNETLLKDFLPDILRFFLPGIELQNDINSQIKQLLKFLTKNRCLLIFDNLESILNRKQDEIAYKEKYENYKILFKNIGEVAHQSCLIITSREKDPQISELENKTRYVRSLHLDGLNYVAGKALMASVAKLNKINILGTEAEWEKIIDFYNGNPLALKLAADYISRVCSGSIKEFFKSSSGRLLFKTFEQLLDYHFDMLSESEKDVIFWLAINQKPVSSLELKEDILSPNAQEDVLLILESLENKLSIQTRKVLKIVVETKSPTGDNKLIDPQPTTIFSLHPIILEYTIKTLIDTISQELIKGEINFFNKYALIKATTDEIARNNQTRLILEPIKKRLEANYNIGSDKLKEKLTKIIDKLREKLTLEAGYAGGNLVNFIYYLTRSLDGENFSRLFIRQAYLQGLQLQNTNFSYSHFDRSIFTNKLSHVLSVALSPYGNAVATGDSSGEICIWNVGDGGLLQRFENHDNWVWSIKFQPTEDIDGITTTILASASDDKTVRIWDVIKGEHLKILTELPDQQMSHDDWARCVDFNHDGKLLASGSDDANIKIWDVQTRKYLGTLEGHKLRVWSVAFNHDGTTLVSGSDDRKVIVWKLAELDIEKKVNILKPHKVLNEHGERVQAVAFSSDGRWFASGSADATVRIWNASTYSCETVIQCGESRIWSLAFIPGDSGKIAVASDDPVLRIYDIETIEPFRTFIGHKSRIRSVSFTSRADRLMLASGSEDKTVKIWDVDDGKCLQTFEGKTDRVWSVAFSNDGKYLVNGSEDRQVRLWGLENKDIARHEYQCVGEFPERTYWVWSIAVHPSNSKLIATGSDEKIVKIWNIEKNDKPIKQFAGHANWILAVAFSHDGKFLASGSEDTTVKIWDINAEECLVTLADSVGYRDRVRSIAFHPQQCNFLASGSDDKKIIIWHWDRDTGKFKNVWSNQQEDREYQKHQSRIRSVVFSPDGEYLASSSDDTKIIIWKTDIHTDNNMAVSFHKMLHGHTDKVVSLAFHPNGKYLASSSDDTTVRIWDFRTGKCLKVLRGHTKWVRSVAFRYDGILASSSQDETIRLWDIRDDNFLNLEDLEYCPPLKAKGPYQDMNITGIKGLTPTQINTLKALGAVDNINQDLLTVNDSSGI